MMKKLFFFFLILSSIYLVSCIEDKYLAEQYIKTSIEEHKDGNFSAIKIYSLYSTTCYDGAAYIEFTAYKFNDTKGLVIAADDNYSLRHRVNSAGVLPPVNYVQLDVNQCKAILDNYKTLLQKIKDEKPGEDEEVYQDYTVSKDLFISYSKFTNSFDNSTMYIWVKGQKFEVSTYPIVSLLNKFIKY